RTDLVIAPSQFLADVVKQWGQPVRVIRLGLPNEHLTGIPPVQERATLRLGYIGQIAPHKGVHLLITAVKQIPPSDKGVELTIFGNQAHNPAYTRQLQRLIGNHPHIHLAGPFNHDQLPAILSTIDVIVVPSIWYENSPITIMEAHAAGRPVITSRLGGMAELVRDEVDGLHFTPNDSRDLARQLQRLRSETGLLERLRDGIQPPRSFAAETQTLLEHYITLLEQRDALRGSNA
ncbi:MAG: glycosyl transferase family 1, partial [Chloroflexus aggregans]